MLSLRFLQLRFLRLVAILVVVPVFAPSRAHAQASAAPPIPVASGVTYERVARYDLARLERIVSTELVDAQFAKTPPATFAKPRYPVTLYRVTYPSIVPEQGNRPTIASGLLAIPDGAGDALPVVSYQHGTVFAKTTVPSFPDQSMETRLMVAQFAGQGYVVVAADYFGKGTSTEPDSYLVKQSAQQACVDMLHASKAVLASMQITPREFFISGWSQGGWGTLVFLEKLESLGIAVKAAATASAPTDIYVTVNRWVNNPQPIDAAYLPAVIALQLLAYEHYYAKEGFGARAVRPEYVEACRDLYANRIDWTTFRAKTPLRAPDMLRPEFVASGASGDAEYWSTLQDEHGCRWRSHTPLRCYYGDIDEVVPVAIAKLPEEFHTLMGGGPTKSVAAGSTADHRGTFLFAVADQLKWFEEMRAQR